MALPPVSPGVRRLEVCVTPETLATALRAAGYEPRRPEVLAVAAALAQRGDGLPALLLEGPPGVGKSALATAVAVATGRRLIAHQAHAWTDADELFVGVDVQAAVAGESANVRQDGVLAIAARASASPEGCVLLLDELDKSQERAEALLLDWLQTGRVPVAPGRHLMTRAGGCLVLITSNAQRPLSDALLRRVGRVRMDPLPIAQQVALLGARTALPGGVVRALWVVAREAATADGAIVSLQEGYRILEAMEIVEGVADLRHVLATYGARGPKGRALVARDPRLTSLWGAIVAARRMAA